MATKKPSNPFDAIAKPAAPAKKSASNKIAAEVNDEISNAVDLIIAHKAEIKRLEAEMDDHSDKVRDHVFKQQAQHARKGNYSKTFDVKGNVGNLTYVSSDRWTLPKEADLQEALQTFLGKRFEEWFETRRTITLKPAAADNGDLIGKLSKAIEAAGFSMADVFEVTDALKSKKDLDENQFELDDKALTQFRTICKQYKAGLK
jgi:hypothetical protein